MLHAVAPPFKPVAFDLLLPLLLTHKPEPRTSEASLGLYLQKTPCEIREIS